ncbi:MAG: diguanylate cyclase [Candidatus Aminicenantes bacterium]
MSDGRILILNSNTQEREHLTRLCSTFGTAHPSSDLPGAVDLLETKDFHVLVVDYQFARFSSLKGLLKKQTSLVITGSEEKKIKDIIKEWPLTRYIDYHLTPLPEQNNEVFLRILQKAAEHSRLRREVENLKKSIQRNEMDLKDAYSEIKEIKNVIYDSVIKELEKRIELEAKYIWSKREKKKLEEILKSLYTASDVTNLLDIVLDIREIVNAKGISLYIQEENETLGKYLKPLVWDNAFLSPTVVSQHVVRLDAQDFAASAARYGQEINTADLEYDARLSQRYIQNLDYPLRSILSVPIMYDKQIIGALEVYNKTGTKADRINGFSDEDLQILRTLSDHIAIAITKLNLIQYDALTGLLRPDPFFEKIIQNVKYKRKRREEEASYAVVMGDVDWFKNYNDRNGQEAGNRLLRDLAKIFKSSTREEDLVCRYGGEEFLFFLSGVNSIEEACQVTERIRKKVEDHYFDYQEFQPRNNVTMSFGLTFLPREKIDPFRYVTKNDLKRLAHEADMAVAEAKGKNSALLPPNKRKEAGPVKNKVYAYYNKHAEEKKEEGTIEAYKEKQVKERRRHQRFYTSTSLIYRRNSSHNVTKTINLSLGGAKISSDAKLPISEIFDLILILGSKACQLKGEVVYSQKEEGEFFRYHSGLKFKELSSEDREILEDYFASLRMEESSPLTH